MTMAALLVSAEEFGYGATPNTWQGWLFTIVLALFIAALAFGADFVRDDSGAVAPDRSRPAAWC